MLATKYHTLTFGVKWGNRGNVFVVFFCLIYIYFVYTIGARYYKSISTLTNEVTARIIVTEMTITTIMTFPKEALSLLFNALTVIYCLFVFPL